MIPHMLKNRPLLTIARKFSTEIPINRVARVLRFNVGNEANGIICDDLLKTTIPLFKTVDGYVKIERTVCKSEWAYEIQVIFDSITSFKGYMETKEALGIKKKMAGIRELAQEYGTVYEGARVFDEIEE